MGKETNIQWCHSSLNLQMGCDGCELWNSTTRKCYAGRQTQKWQGKKGWPINFETPTLFLERLDPALKWGPPSPKEREAKPWIPADFPRIIFLNDMGDTFARALPLNWMAPLLPLFAASPHQFLLLTKRPSRLVEFSKRFPLPANVWPGTTVTSAATRERVTYLRGVHGGGPKFLSIEPMWGDIDWTAYDGMDWVIFGGESGDPEEYRNVNVFRLEWLQRGLDLCAKYGVRPFVKQFGLRPIVNNVPLTLRDPHGGNWDEWPEQFRVRLFPHIQTVTQPELLD